MNTLTRSWAPASKAGAHLQTAHLKKLVQFAVVAFSIFLSVLLPASSWAEIASPAQTLQAPQLEVVASFPTQQVTGIAVSSKGRIFVNFPFWSDDHTTSVAEVMPDGTLKPYPDGAWNRKDGPPEGRWVCVQSVYIDDNDALWVLDPAAPKTESVVKGGAKLVKFDLTSDRPVQTIAFQESITPERSYLNDVRVETASNHAFITDSGTGALVVVDLTNNSARRVLVNHASTKAEPGAEIVVDGMPVIDPKTGRAPAIQADGIALDKQGGWLYYHALTGKTLYRIRTEFLRDVSLNETQLEANVENLDSTPKPDGMLAGQDGGVYLTAFEQNAIVRFDPASRSTKLVVQDERLQWPDSLAWGPDGKLYVTTSQIHRMPKFQNGVSQQKGPFRVYRVEIPRTLAAADPARNLSGPGSEGRGAQGIVAHGTAGTAQTAQLDLQMSAVLDRLATLGGKPIEALSPQEARQQPSPFDASNQLATEQGKTVPEAVGSVENTTINVGDHTFPVRVYTPSGDGPFPVILYVHGGGWVIGDLDAYDASPRALCNLVGAVVVSTHYRQAPEHKFPAAHEDVFSAYQWVLNNAANRNYDPRRIGVVGESAGANMAAATCMMAKERGLPLPLRQVLVYPVADLSDLEKPSYQEHARAKPLNKTMMQWFAGHLLAKPEDANNPRLSLLLAGDELKGLPPTTIILAQIDPLRSEGEALGKALQDAGVEVNVKTYNGVTHEFFGMAATVDKAKEAQQAVADDLKASLSRNISTASKQ